MALLTRSSQARQRCLTVQDSMINSLTTDKLLHQFNIRKCYGQKVIVDLTQANWINAAGLVGLALFLSVLLLQNNSVVVRTLDPRLTAYLNYLNFFNVCEDFYREGKKRPLWASSRLTWDRRKSEMKNVDSVPSYSRFLSLRNRLAAGELLGDMHMALCGSLGFDQEMASTFCQVVSELFGNTDQHSGSSHGGLVAIEIIAGTSPARAILAVGDIGVGIPDKLREGRLLGRDTTDRKAIELAVGIGVSTVGAPGRGGGLARCKEYASSFGYAFAIRSGRGYYFFQQHKERSKPVEWFPGTQAYFGLLG